MEKLIYIAMNLASLAVGVYKVHSMGLLPTAQSDWLDTTVKPHAEISVSSVVH
jgi:hypothetical protein